MRLKTNYFEKLTYISSVLFALFFFLAARFGILTPELTRGLYIGGTSLIVIFASITSRENKLLKLLDFLLIISITSSIIYFVLEYPNISTRIGITTKYDLIFGTILIISVLELTRRRSSKILAAIALFFLLYALLGNYLPGMIRHQGFSYSRVISFMYTSLYGIFGSITRVFSNYIFMFIIFGTFMEKSGGAEFLIDLSYSITGKYRGGPAKSAVIASGLVGSISGSAIANVMTTGTFTIPLMKKSGYRPHVAAAIETASSLGGQLAPPIMGAGIFIMVELTGIPYSKIALLSIFPAFLYFYNLLLMVDIESKKTGIVGLSKANLPDTLTIIKNNWFHFIPVTILILLIIYGNSPAYSSFWATLSTIIVSWISKEKRMNLKDILNAFSESTIKSLSIGATAGSLGLIIGAVYLTGLGLKFSSIMLTMSNNSLVLTIFLIAVASYILGMGLTVTSSYIILAVLAAPALINLGLEPISAHLIIFWLSQDANVTPPVCLAAFSAASLAGSHPMKTGWTALKYSKSLYIVPLLIAYTPILLNSSLLINIITIINCMLGFTLFSYLSQRYFAKKQLSLSGTIVLTICTVLFFIPNIATSILSTVIIGIYYFISR